MTDEKPWLRLWRHEEGSFAQLPLRARCLHAEMLKLTDGDGRIDIGEKEPVAAIAFAFGADRSDRRFLKTCLPLLFNEGCLVREPNHIRFSGWGKRQPGANSTPTEPRRSHEATTTAPRPRHDRATTEGVSARNHTPRKCTEQRQSRDRTDLEGGGVSDLGTLRGLDRVSLPPADEQSDRVRLALRGAWSDAWLHKTTQPATSGVLHRVGSLAPWLIDYAKRRPESAEELAPVLIGAFFVAKAKYKRPNVAWLVDQDTGQYLEKPEGKRTKRARRDAAQAEQESHFDREMARAERSALPRDEVISVGQALVGELKAGAG